jgi:hypothetical protein
MIDGKNGEEVLDMFLKQAEELSRIPADSGAPDSNSDNVDVNPTKLAEAMVKAARQLGDGKSSSPNTHTPTNEPESMMGEPNTDPEAMAAKGPELSMAIKEAVLSHVNLEPSVKEAAAARSAKALKIGIPLAGLGMAGAYAGGRIHGDNIDKKNNQAYYEAGIYDGARKVIQRLKASMGGAHGKQ